MKGQASMEALLLLIAVLAVAAGFLYQGIESSNSVNAVAAAKNGAENAISSIEIENSVTIMINDVKEQNENIRIILDNWGGKLPKNAENRIREDALEFLYQAFNGNFPGEKINSVATANHIYKVSVEIKG